MPVMRSMSIWPTRIAWPRREDRLLPALATASPVPPPYRRGRAHFTLSPLHLAYDQLLFLVVAALLAIGLVMVQSADARVRGTGESALVQTFLTKNVLHAGVAIAAMTLAWRLDYRRLLGRSLLASPATWLVLLTVVCLLAVFVPGLGKEVNGARRWLGAGPVQFQPSELAKLALVVFIAAYAAHSQRQVRDFGIGMLPILSALLALTSVGALVVLPLKHDMLVAKIPALASESLQLKLNIGLAIAAGVGLAATALLWRYTRQLPWSWGYLPLVCIFGLVTALVVKEDFGTTALIAVACFFLMIMAGCRLWHVGLLIPPGALAVWALIFRDPNSFRYRRFVAFWNPWADPKGVGYHPIQSLLTIMSGGFWGRGLGNGIQKMGYLPEDNTDFIFAVICEELGFFGALIVIALFATFVFCGWRIACRSQHLFGKMVAFGITAIIGLQAAMNIAVVTVTMPTKGIALPMISSGGTGWIMNALAVGVLMSIERVTRLEAEAANRPAPIAEPALGFPVELSRKSETLPVSS